MNSYHLAFRIPEVDGKTSERMESAGVLEFDAASQESRAFVPEHGPDDRADSLRRPPPGERCVAGVRWRCCSQ